MPNRNALIRSRLDTVPTADDFPYTLTSGPSLTTSQLLDNLSIGMGYGATNQLKGTWDMVAHPINAIKGIGSLAKQAVTQPNKLAAALMAYGKQGVTSGPLEFGRFVGENLSLRTPGRLPTDRVDMLPPSLRKRLADATRYNDRNPRKLANEMVRAGTVPAELRDEIAGALTDIRATRQFRRENRPLRVDPLQQNAIHRAEKAKALSSVKSFDSLPPSADWASNRAETVRSLAAAGRIDDAFDEATKATLEAITRKARAQGLTVRHTSTGRDGRVSSRYITLPDGREVRISDHHIPLTPEREFNRAISGNQPWSREIIVSARDGKTIGDYLREILE